MTMRRSVGLLWFLLTIGLVLVTVHTHPLAEEFYPMQHTLRTSTSTGMKLTTPAILYDTIIAPISGNEDFISTAGEEEEEEEELSELSIRISNGTIQHLDTYPGLWVQTKSSVAAVITGLVDDIRSYFDDGMVAVNPPSPNWVGVASVHFGLNDGRKQNQASSSILQLNFDPQIEFKIRISHESIDLLEDESVLFADRTVTISVEHMLAVRNINCQVGAKQGTTHPGFINGTVSSIVQMFQSIAYRPSENFNGMDTIFLDCENNLDQVCSISLSMNVQAVNDLPKIIMPKKKELKIDEDIPYTFGGAGIYISDVDAREQADALVAVDLQLDIGSIILPHVSRLGGIRTMRRDSASASHLRMIGHLDDVNMAMQFLTLVFPSDWFGNALLFIKSIDSVHFDMKMKEIRFEDDWVTDHFTFHVQNVNDAARILVNKEKIANFKQGDIVRFDEGAIQVIDTDGKSDDIYLFRWTLKVGVASTLPGKFVPARVENGDIVTGGQQLDVTHNTVSILEQRGTLSELNDFKHFQLVLNEHWFGDIYGLTLEVVDSSGGSAIERIIVSVAKVNTCPVFNALNHNLTTEEDSPLDLSSIFKLVDPREGKVINDIVNVFKLKIMTKMGGLLLLNSVIEGSHLLNSMDIDEPQSELQMKGPISVLNNALASSLFYTPPPDMDTFDILSLSVYDSSNHICDQMKVHIDIEEVNDAPIIELPAALRTVADDGTQYINFSGIKVIDDGRDSQVLMVLFGLEPPTVGDLIGIAGDAWYREGENGSYLLEGSLDYVNDVMQEIIVSVNDDYIGEAYLFMKATDAKGASSTERITFDVDNIVSVPRPIVKNESFVILEDSHIDLKELFILEATTRSNRKKFEMKISTHLDPSDSFAAPFLFQLSKAVYGVHFPYHDFGQTPAETFAVRGRLDNLNDAVNAVRLVPPPGYFGEIIVKVQIYEVPGIDILVKEILVSVSAVDNPPLVEWHGIEIKRGDIFMKLSEDASMSLRGAEIVDIDNANETIAVQLSLQKGSLCYLERFQELIESTSDEVVWINEDGVSMNCVRNDEATLSVTSHIASVNEVLHSLLYKPLLNWFGLDLLHFEVESQNKNVTSSLKIFVEAMSDAPIVILPKASLIYEVDEGEVIIIKNINIEDADISSTVGESIEACTLIPQVCYVTVEFEALNGALSLLNHNGITSITDASGRMIMTGLLDHVNSVLQWGIVYEPNSPFHGMDHLQISAADSDGMNSKDEIIEIHVQAKNRSPEISFPRDDALFSLVEDTLAVIGAEYCFDSDFTSAVISCDSFQIVHCENYAVNETMKLSMSWENGTFRLPRLKRSGPTLASTIDSSTTNGFLHEINLEDTIDILNWLIGSIHLKGNLNVNTEGRNLETLNISVQCGESQTSAILYIAIEPVADPPVIEIESGLLDTNESTADGLGFKSFGIERIILKEDSSIRLQGIRVRDVDCDPEKDLLELSVVSRNGYVYFPPHVFARQWISGDQRVSQNITVRSTIAELNKVGLPLLSCINLKQNTATHTLFRFCNM